MMAVQHAVGASLCSAFVVLAIHTAAFIVACTDTPVFDDAARGRQIGFPFKAKQRKRRGRSSYRRLARGKQDIQVFSQTATAAALKTTAIVEVAVDIGVRVKGTEIEWTRIRGRSSIRAKEAAKEG
jgi:hypothetical protein